MTEQAKQSSLYLMLRLLKRLGAFVLLLCALGIIVLTVVFFALKTSSFKSWTKDQLVNYFELNFENEISIQAIDSDFFKGMVIKDVLLLDHHQDTLLYAEQINVGLRQSIISLIENQLNIQRLDMEHLRAKIITYPIEQTNSLTWMIRHSSFYNKKSTGAKRPFQLNAKSLIAKQANLDIIQVDKQTTQHIGAKHIEATFRNIDFIANILDCEEIILTEAYFQEIKNNEAIICKNPEDIKQSIPKKIDETDICKNPFLWRISDVIIHQSNVLFKDYCTVPLVEKSFDPSNIELRNVKGTIENVIIEGSDIQAQYIRLSGKDQNEFNYNQISASALLFNKQELSLHDFILRTDRSFLGDSLSLLFPEEGTSDNPFVDGYVKAKIRKANIEIEDLVYFVPNLRTQAIINQNRNRSIQISGDVNGKINNLKGFQIQLDIDDQFHFDGNFSLRNVLKKGEELLNLKAKQAVTSVAFLRKVIPGRELPEMYNSLGRISFSGEFDGFFADFVAHGTFNTQLGKAHTDMRLDLSNGRSKASYSGSAELIDFNLGKLANLKDLETVSLQASVRNGQGLTWQTLNADLDANIKLLVFKQYAYRNIDFNGKLTKDLLDGKMQIADANIQLGFDGKITNLNTIPRFNFQSKVSRLDLRALNLLKDSIVVSGNIHSDISGKSINDLSGSVIIQNLIIIQKGTENKLGDISFEQSLRQGIKTANIQAPFAKLKLQGNYQMADIGKDLMAYADVYMPNTSQFLRFPKRNNALNRNVQYTLTGEIMESPELNRVLAPMHLQLGNGNIDYSFTNAPTLSVIDFKYSSTHVKIKQFKILEPTVRLFVLNGNGSFDISTRNLFNQDSSVTSKVKLSGAIKADSIYYDLSSAPNDPHFNTLGWRGNILFKESSLVSNISESQVIYDGRLWAIDPKNRIEWSKDAISIEHFDLTDQSKFFSLRDINKKGVDIKSEGFNISLVNAFIKNKKVKFDGLFALRIKVPDIYQLRQFEGSLDIFQCYFMGTNRGPLNISFKLDDPKKPVILSLKNQFHNHRVVANGTYNLPLIKDYPLPRHENEFDVVLTEYPLSILQNFIAGISGTEGSLSGKVKLSYKKEKFGIDGTLTTQAGKSTINYLGTTYAFNDQRVRFSKDTIDFSGVNFVDKQNNTLTAQGFIFHKNLASFSSNLVVSSPRAIILDTDKKNNPFYYGFGIGSFSASFIGPFSATNINVRCVTAKGSKLFIPINYDQEAKETGFVRFVSHKVVDTIKQVASPINLQGLDFYMDLSLTEDAEVSLIFDEQAGDKMKGNGRGDLNIHMHRDGTFTVNGDYEFESGQYLFTLLNFVNKPFKIERGGTIRWNGAPLDASIDIVAKYDGLYSNMTTFLEEYLSPDENDPTRIEAKRRTPVSLGMLLKGSLLKPEINFEIEFPELTGNLKSLADSKMRILEQEQDLLNQQVFGLLVFGSFLNSNNPFSGTIASNLGSSTINTVSEFLSSQLSLMVSNLLSEALGDVKFISGIDFNIGYDVYDSRQGFANIENGEFAFRIQNRLFNDAFILTLGGNVGSSSQINNTSYFNGESSIEWNTPLPGLKLRLFVKSEESIQGGLKRRYGGGASFRKEFDSFRDFKKEVTKQVKDSNETKG